NYLNANFFQQQIANLNYQNQQQIQNQSSIFSPYQSNYPINNNHFYNHNEHQQQPPHNQQYFQIYYQQSQFSPSKSKPGEEYYPISIKRSNQASNLSDMTDSTADTNSLNSSGQTYKRPN